MACVMSVLQCHTSSHDIWCWWVQENITHIHTEVRY